MNRSLFFWFLRFRLKQLLRIGLDIGAASALIIIAIIVIAFSALYIKSYESGYLPLAVFALVCAWLHSSRGDKNFVGMYIRKSYILFWSEYACLSLPFMFISMANLGAICILYFGAICLIVPFIANFRLKLPAFSFHLFRKGSYEYQIMLRKKGLLLAACYLVALLGVWNGNERVLYVFASLFSFIFIGALIVSEDIYYTRFFTSASHFVRHRLLCCVCNFSILFFPFLLIGIQFIPYMIVIYGLSILSLLAIRLLTFVFNNNLLLVVIYSSFFLMPLLILILIYPIVVLALVAGMVALIMLAKERFKGLLLARTVTNQKDKLS